MSVIGIKEYVRQQAAATPMTNIQTFLKVTAYRQRMKREIIGSNIVVTVGDVRRHEKRATSPRGIGTAAGEKDLSYDVQLLAYAGAVDAQQGGDDFDTFIEALSYQFRNPTLPASVMDPNGSGATTVVSFVGEEMVDDLLPPTTTQLQGRVRFRVVKTLTVTEYINA